LKFGIPRLKNGFERGLYILYTASHGFNENPVSLGFDASWDFLIYIRSPKNNFYF